MADSAASPNTRVPRSRSTKQRTATVSTETENKLARAARSAQRLAQLSDVARDGSTLDLFPDDPTRATLEAMTIDVRQGTLRGFELPAEVLAAVGLSDGGEPLLEGQDAKPARRVTRAAKAGETASASVQTSVLDEREEPTLSVANGPGAGMGATAATAMPATDDVAAKAADAAQGADSAPANTAAAGQEAAVAEPVDASASSVAVSRVASVLPAAPSMSSSVLRGVAAARASDAAASAQSATSQQRSATSVAKTATALREATASGDAMAAGDVTSKGSPFAGRASAALSTDMPDSSVASDGTSARPYVASQPQPATHAAPELDRARATAFADTVDALYGVISDQRRAATDHSRRMKWMLSIVVGALLVTVAIGITQTMLLMRLTRETTAQQQRIEQMMLNQQATLSTLLDTDSATFSGPAIAPPSPAAPAPAPAVAPRPSEQPAAKHATKSRQAHKAKPATPH
ncbi:hypothetical protein B0G77_6483 [Paraburkholderia sp. BL10I2N1]|nr:hypothetical protein [Paraburkholderia sp. BL10I2N1]TDN62890.1 hypothetical protein B0G77_6483 [Paraburkholderia sp. BL10I2N1]